MNFDKRLKLNNFQEATTYKNDYRPYSPQKRYKYQWAKPKIDKPPKPTPEYYQQDTETFFPFKKEHHVPFNILWQPRPIIETGPRKSFPKSLKNEESYENKEEAIKSRPRLYMSPAISLDDIEEKELRNMICDGVYKTEWRRAEEEVLKYLKTTKRDVFDSVLDKGYALELDIDLHPPLPAGWKMLGEKWDNKQKRALVDPTKQFWLNTELKPREENSPFEKLVPKEVKTEIAELIANERLRLPHDKVKPGYVGYTPKLSKGVQLAKNDFQVTHPSISVSQAIAKRWKNN